MYFALSLHYNHTEMFLTDVDTGETADSSKTLAEVDTETEKKGMSTDSVKFKTGE